MPIISLNLKGKQQTTSLELITPNSRGGAYDLIPEPQVDD